MTVTYVSLANSECSCEEYPNFVDLTVPGRVFWRSILVGGGRFNYRLVHQDRSDVAYGRIYNWPLPRTDSRASGGRIHKSEYLLALDFLCHYHMGVRGGMNIPKTSNSSS
jgi:hypothetical protein